MKTCDWDVCFNGGVCLESGLRYRRLLHVGVGLRDEVREPTLDGRGNEGERWRAVSVLGPGCFDP